MFSRCFSGVSRRRHDTDVKRDRDIGDMIGPWSLRGGGR
ncbi:hypothetical protein Ae168Ps1_1788c [Pseudonocardia sp. Ae168_Ps1]|nr:hypothetical protein Ae150APs1_1784c [Pseudonocardia sp. Ae150A_Ps1]OLL79382.1 hypothetical protein Ae168Ps1_1788c [Pseudonocardia sp. Ae168_Ps1]OLL86483.1 hypothetical protein Ae263Ps1_3538 [Pseudonocardia sp. Ae263_Ps1]OLL93468.1 hypothetical protein Ae356Ps1_3365c [Pseudonocardia sp. Ae356_Ps1]